MCLALHVSLPTPDKHDCELVKYQLLPIKFNWYGVSGFRYSHIEAECPFITFDELLERLEDLVVDVVERVLASPLAHLVKELNPTFQVPKRPFKRMQYTEAIDYLKANNITKEDGSFYEFGEVKFIFDFAKQDFEADSFFRCSTPSSKCIFVNWKISPIRQKWKLFRRN